MDNRNQIEEIKSKLDISTVIQQYVPSLKRSGRNYFGLCPFHKEKTPSFSVNPDLGLFKCFGCGEGGDVIKFIEKIENVDFPNALEMAANRAGVVLKSSGNYNNGKFKEEKDKLLLVNKLSAQLYNYILTTMPSGAKGRKYTEKRKLKKEQIEDFLIGYAPKSYDNLKNFLNKKGFDNHDLVKWGLLVEKNGKIYDKFRDRLMFPIKNHQGEVVGFSGRKLDEDDLGPKYLNSPETLVYKKSHLLYGLFQAKDAIRDKGFVILVEGNVDLLSSHGAGMKNIVAPLGTALTEEQLKLVKRYCEKLYFAFDTDSAGQKALLKSFSMAENVGLESYVIEIKGYKDVDELIMAGGDWKNIVENAKETVAYLIDSVAKKYDLTNTKYKAKYLDEVLTYVKYVKNNFAISDYLKKISQKTDMNEEVLILELEKVKSTQPQIRYEPMEEKHNVKNNINKKMDLIDLMVEFISLIINNQNQEYEEKFVTKVLGSGPAYKILQFLQKGEVFDEAEKYKDIIENIQMKPQQVIDDNNIFNYLLKNLGNRILSLKARKQIQVLKKDMEDGDIETIKKIQDAAKLLKS
jgi:DNA primase